MPDPPHFAVGAPIAGPSTPPRRSPRSYDDTTHNVDPDSPTVTSLLLPPGSVGRSPHGEDMDFDDSDSSIFDPDFDSHGDDGDGDGDGGGGNRGTRDVEMVNGVWGKRSQWFLFIGIGLSSYIYSLDGLTTWQYLNYATSYVLEHSLSGTISTAQAIIIAVGKPFMAKLADVIGRGETFIIVTILYVLGYGVIATASDIRQIATGSIFYAFGYTGLQMMQQIVIADMTTLRWRGLVSALVSAPFIVNNFIAAEITARVLPNWRWGYGMFAILVPLSLLPIIGALLWAQRKAKRQLRTRTKGLVSSRPSVYRKWSTMLNDSCEELDLIGLLIVATSLSLVLLPLGVAPKVKGHWQNPGMIVMIALGILLFPIFVWFEARIPSKPLMPMRWLKRGPILGACLIGFCDFVSFYLQNTYLYSYVYVTRDWTYRGLTYFSAIQTISLTIFGIVGGWLMYHTQRFKIMLVCGLLIRLLGVTLMLKARSLSGTALELILTQALQGAGGGFAAIAIQVSAQAAVSHADVATVTAMVLLLTEVGNSVGSAVATGVWTQYMPGELARFVPTSNTTLLEELFGSMEDIARYPIQDPIRQGAIQAYESVMSRLVFASVITAIFPPIFCVLLTQNIKLGKTQNAREGKDLSGIIIREEGERGRYGGIGKGRRGGRVRLRSESGVSGIAIFDSGASRGSSEAGNSPRTLARILEAEAGRASQDRSPRSERRVRPEQGGRTSEGEEL